MGIDWNAPPEARIGGEPDYEDQPLDIVERLAADELPGERQQQREARVVLRKLLDGAAREIEELRLFIAQQP